MFRDHVSAPRKLAMLAAAAAVALGLSACGGGGGGGTATGGSPRPSVPSGGGSPTSTGEKTPSLTAGGVTVGLRALGGGGVGVVIRKGDDTWAIAPNHRLTAPATGWKVDTRLNSSVTHATHRFHVVHDASSSTDDDYLAYGHWATNFDKPTEKPDFESFFNGNQPYTGSVPSGTTTATYTGGAAGIYLTGSPGRWGYFKSLISLSADFSAGTVTATLSGIAELAANSPSFNFGNITTDAATISGGSFTHAKWGGRFFGPSGAAPTGAAGWFEGLTSAESGGGTGSATLQGSFAAKR